MTFTDEQFSYLEKFEKEFTTATQADYVSNPGAVNLQAMENIWNKATGAKEHVNTGCYHCVLRFMKQLGKQYFVDKNLRRTGNR